MRSARDDFRSCPCGVVSRVDHFSLDQLILTSRFTRRMLLRLPRSATYSPILPSCLCDDHSMGSVTGAKPAKALSPVLCVDLDGTLIRGNVLCECILVLLKTRPIALVTAADRELADAIASYLGLFDEVHASDGTLNLKGANKAAFLAQHFAQAGFDYVGDSAADVEVWRNARAAYVVGTEARGNQAA